MNIEEKLRNINNKLSMLLPHFKRICVKDIGGIPIEIDNIVIGVNKLAVYMSNDTPYELNETDLIYVSTLQMSVFNGTDRLTSITFPDSIVSIDCINFANCNGLTDIYLKSAMPPSLNFISQVFNTVTIHVPIGSGDTYRNATNWSYHSDRIVEDITL